MVAFYTLSLFTLAFANAVYALPNPTQPGHHDLAKRAASCTFPTPPRTSTMSAPKRIPSGTTFDGGNVRFDRGAGSCGSGEGGEADAVFILENGATLNNVVIGANQYEGIHCKGTCNINNVWFEDVCEDAITLKGTSTSGIVNINGGGARGASDKVVQHNGAGTVNISNYCVQTFGKLYRSCGNCKKQYQRKVNLSNIIATNGAWSMIGVNSNYGDVATFTTSTISATNVRSWCDTYQGNNSGAEPVLLTTNQKNAYCKF